MFNYGDGVHLNGSDYSLILLLNCKRKIIHIFILKYAEETYSHLSR